MYIKFKDADKKRANKSKKSPQKIRQANARRKQLVRKLSRTKNETQGDY